jgi:hypothetical protein
VELETEVDRRLDAIRALAARTVAEAGPEPDWVATGSPSEAAADIAEAFGLGHHLTAAVECILTGAGEGAHGSESLHEATRLIERYLALVDQQRTGVAPPPRPAPTPRVEKLPAPPPSPPGMKRQLAAIALRWSAVAVVTIAIVVVLTLLVEIR